MSAISHSMESISLAFTEDDYKNNRPEPKLDTYFEWRVADATVKRSKNGKHIAILLKVEALDENASAMFPKYMNVTIPVAIPSESVECPDYAKGMFLSQMAPMYPELGYYDNIEVDPYTGKNVYYKDGEVLSGKAFDMARFEANKRIGAKAREFATVWYDKGDKVSIDELLERRFFGTVKASKDGQYTNVANLSARAPANETVVYTRKEAFKNR